MYSAGILICFSFFFALDAFDIALPHKIPILHDKFITLMTAFQLRQSEECRPRTEAAKVEHPFINGAAPFGAARPVPYSSSSPGGGARSRTPRRQMRELFLPLTKVSSSSEPMSPSSRAGLQSHIAPVPDFSAARSPAGGSTENNTKPVQKKRATQHPLKRFKYQFTVMISPCGESYDMIACRANAAKRLITHNLPKAIIVRRRRP